MASIFCNGESIQSITVQHALNNNTPLLLTFPHSGEYYPDDFLINAVASISFNSKVICFVFSGTYLGTHRNNITLIDLAPGVEDLVLRCITRLDGLGDVCQIRYLGGESVWSGGDALRCRSAPRPRRGRHDPTPAALGAQLAARRQGAARLHDRQGGARHAVAPRLPRARPLLLLADSNGSEYLDVLVIVIHIQKPFCTFNRIVLEFFPH